MVFEAHEGFPQSYSWRSEVTLYVSLLLMASGVGVGCQVPDSLDHISQKGGQRAPKPPPKI